ncbi:MAG: anthranilate synthase component I family protein [Pirellulales bacterium]
MPANDHSLPLVLELSSPPEPEQAFARFAAQPHCVFFDSALRHPTLGRYSFVACDPFEWHQAPWEPAGDPLAELQTLLSAFQAIPVPLLPPFQGGAAGLFGYDLGQTLERLPRPRYDEFRWPPLAVGLYDVVLAYDHAQGKAWLISQGWPESDPARRATRAQQRIDQMRAVLSAPPGKWPRAAGEAVDPTQLAPQHSFADRPGLSSNFAPGEYLQAIERGIEYIRAGDIFQVNLAQRLLARATASPVELYLRLRRQNPATFAGYFDLGDRQLASASPERFLQLRGGLAETRPIKGTRGRLRRPEADLFAGDDLLASDKDRAENVMIVDLLRNDLSRVCLPDTVQVTQLCELEVYAYVQHLVSAVQGRLQTGLGAIDLLRAAFPGGSITGAPKVRAMEIIAELEPTARGPYCGSLGYLSGDGSLDTNILIRTIAASGGWWQAAVGGGIVAPSDPQLEYAETWHKAAGLLRALLGP